MAEANQKTARAVVARGRSVDIPIGALVTVGLTAEGKTVTRRPTKQFGPGNEVELPADEIKSLRKLGYLVDPEATVIPTGEGPMFSATGGAQVSAA